jgi:hypothetical protein
MWIKTARFEAEGFIGKFSSYRELYRSLNQHPSAGVFAKRAVSEDEAGWLEMKEYYATAPGRPGEGRIIIERSESAAEGDGSRATTTCQLVENDIGRVERRPGDERRQNQIDTSGPRGLGPVLIAL